MKFTVFPTKVGASGAPHFQRLTGGVYKARERIHGAVADAPLLAIPASRGRVAALDPDREWVWGLASPFGVASHCPIHCRPRVTQRIQGIRTCRRPHLPLAYRQRSPMSAPNELVSNMRYGSCSLRHLRRHFTARTDDGHALLLSLSGKTFSLTFILLSPLVRFPALSRIEPQPPPLVCSPANSLKFHPCERTPQAAHLTVSLRHWKPT
jgi:hypothetical protein